MVKGGMDFKPNCLATGIGSLPHKDIGAALDLILENLAQIPYWPQLPKLSPRESMVAQFVEGLPCLKFKDKEVIFDTSQDKDEALAQFYEKIIATDFTYFAISHDYAAGLYAFLDRLKIYQPKNIEFLKGQIIGPFTFAASIKLPDGKTLLSDAILMDAVVNGLGMKAVWQIKKLKTYSKKVILFFDEPYLGCFGSGYTPITREEAIKRLNDIIEPIKEEDLLLGIHCCGNTDWSMLTETKIDIISFDAFGFLDRVILYAQDLNRFLSRGGILAWGIVPTNEFKGQGQAELIQRFEDGVETLVKKGISKNLILERSLITPSCGMGTLSEAIAEEVVKLTRQVSETLRKRYFKL